MVFGNLIKWKLLSLLQPWLQEEPRFELKLGIINSQATAKNLRFDCSVLNQLINGPTRWSFEEVTVDELNISFSNWKAPAFSIEVSGIYVALSVGELKEKGCGRQWEWSATYMEDMKKILSVMDPEGSSLHNFLEGISGASSARNWLKTSFLNLILNHCHLRMRDIYVQVRFPLLDDSVAVLLELKELNAVSQFLEHGCLFRGFFGALFLPMKESSLNFNGNGFRISLKGKDDMIHLLTSVDISICSNLNDLQIAELSISTSEFSFFFSLEDLPILLAISSLLSKDSKRIRNGRQLWKLVERKMNHVTSAPRLSLHKVADVVILWLRYLTAYEYLLSLVGYSSDCMLEKSVAKISHDKMVLENIRRQLKLLSEIEKELPAELVARARHVARYKVEVIQNTVSTQTNYGFFYQILQHLAYIWEFIYRIFHSVAAFLFQRRTWAQKADTSGHNEIVPQTLRSCHFVLNLREVSITVSQVSKADPSNEIPHSHCGVLFPRPYSFMFSIDELLLMHEKSICKQSLLISCGKLKVDAESFGGSPAVEGGSKQSLASTEGQRFSNDLKTILWVEPVEKFLLTKSSKINSHRSSGDSFLEVAIREMLGNWKNACVKTEESEIECSRTPCFLSEIKTFLTCLGVTSPDCGVPKCCLAVGKLNLALNFSSVLSVVLFLRQLQNALSLTEDSGKTTSHFQMLKDMAEQPDNSWNNKYKFFSDQVKRAIFPILSWQHIQFGVLVAGPHILLSLRKERCNSGNGEIYKNPDQDDFYVAIDVQNIEIAVWPILKSDLVSLSEISGIDDLNSNSLWLKEPQKIDISEMVYEQHTSEREISFSGYLKVHGLHAYLGDSAEKQESQILMLKPIFVQVLLSRNHTHSFSTSVSAISAAVYGRALGLAVFSYVDELHIFLQVLVSLFSQISAALNCINDVEGSLTQEYMKQVTQSVQSGSESALSDSSLKLENIVVSIDGSFKLNSLDLVVKGSRLIDNTEYMKSFDSITSKRLSEQGLLDCGLLISVQQTCFVISFSDREFEILTDMSGIMCVIFRYQNKGRTDYHSIHQDTVLESLDCLYEISVYSSKFSLWMGPPTIASPQGRTSNTSRSTFGANKSCLLEYSSPENDSERSNAQNMSASDNLFFASLSVSKIFVGSCSVKKALVGTHTSDNLLSSLHAGRGFQTISLVIKGGTILLETLALSMFICYISSYHDSIAKVLLTTQDVREGGHEMTESNDHCTRPYSQGTGSTSQVVEREPAVLSIDASELSLILAIEDESGGIWELVLEVDVHSSLELTNMTRRFRLDLTRLTILSQFLDKGMPSEIQTPHFSSSTSYNVPMYGNYDVVHQDENMICSANNESCSEDQISSIQFIENNDDSEILFIIHQNCIMKHLNALISAEKLEEHCLCSNHNWCGSGSLSGFDVTISLDEIQRILSMAAPLSKVMRGEERSELRQSYWSSNQEHSCNLEAIIPNGAIVAIQDAHQHIYIAVEGGQGKYNLFGTNHYSLVGEKAMFEVKYVKQRMWTSHVSWFSLMSVYAKNNSGEPLRLNYRPRSDFVDISSTNDSAGALWRALPLECDSYEGDIDWGPYNQSFRDAFYLVNKKNDSAVAFIDGVLEFVSKPGNPFKLKVFHDLSVVRDVTIRNSLRGHLQHNSCRNERTMENSGKVPCINFRIDRVSLTVVHKLLKTMDMVPLLQGCITDTQCSVQILPTKARVISTLSAELRYFDAQSNLWREMIDPVEICIFYRVSFHIQGTQTNVHKIPVHFHCRTRELNIYLTQLSLDVLLFVVGELNLAGPYAVRNSVILANSCKVENHSGLNLLCQFQRKQNIRLARKQSASIFFRPSALANRSPEVPSGLSIQLAGPGSFKTSSVEISYLEPRVLAWKTRIVSLQDARTYPGPFVIVDISRKPEDGLAIAVSPLIRIHNETRFPMELRFRRPQLMGDESASVILKTGDTIDDSVATFDAINASGGLKKALMSLSLGNYLCSFRPEITDTLHTPDSSLSVEWSDDLKSGKKVRLTGVFDKLSYRVRKALSVNSVKCFFSTASCIVSFKDSAVATLHFLIMSIQREVPVERPDKSSDEFGNGNSPIALQKQQEIFLLPTVQVSNFLHSDIHVILNEKELCSAAGFGDNYSQSTLSYGSTVDFYCNPAIIYFTVTITACNASCKPVNSADWVKKLHKQKNDQYLDIDLDFDGGKYCASLRLSRGHRGILEAVVFTSYAIRNESDFSLLIAAHSKKASFRDEVGKFSSNIPPELGVVLPPKSTGSWFLKSNILCIKLVGSNSFGSLLDLDTLSGVTEIGLEMEKRSGVIYMTSFGVSAGPSSSKVVTSQIVTMVPRYVVSNESSATIIARQCYLEDDAEDTIFISSKQRTILQLRKGICRRKEFSLFENIIRKHRTENDDLLKFVQFRLNEPDINWSGPICISSLGCFFLKFRKQQPTRGTALDDNITEFASVHVVKEGSAVVLYFHTPPNVSLPYRIENLLPNTSLTYYQKDSSEPEILGAGCSVDYVWDDLTLPHKLAVQISGMHLLREINLDKVRAWKPFSKIWQQRGIASHLLLTKNAGEARAGFGEDMIKVGYEVYADGPTRVLRICEYSESHKRDSILRSSAKMHLGVPQFCFHLLELGKQDMADNGKPIYTPIIVARVGHISLDSVLTVCDKYSQISVQSLNVEPRWGGAPFASILRRHQLDNNSVDLKISVVIHSTDSDVVQIRYSSFVLQPVDLYLDEETLMRIVPFKRSSLSDPNSPSRQFYFDHFEIHPIKIIATFLPGESYSSYSSAQETLRSLLHSIIKVPQIKNMVVELNGVLVTHALITTRELLIRCAQHYSWHAMRAIALAKGSSYLPPEFSSIFDDLASSSLDVFFDPADGLNIPGFTIGTFKFISKCINGKGVSGTRRYFGDLGKTLRTAGSNALFAVVTEISDSVLKGAETSGFKGMVSGFHQGILRLAMEPSVLGTALMEGGPNRKIKLDQSAGSDELYIEGYLQAMLDVMYKQEYLRVRVIDDEVLLKNLPPNSSLIEEIMDRVKGFLVSKALLKGGHPSTTSRPLRRFQGQSEWKIGPTVLTLCEHLFVSFSIRLLRKQAGKFIGGANQKKELKKESEDGGSGAVVPADSSEKPQKVRFVWKWGIGKFILSGILAYVDGRLCRYIPNPLARRIVSGFLLSFIDRDDNE